MRGAAAGTKKNKLKPNAEKPEAEALKGRQQAAPKGRQAAPLVPLAHVNP